MISVLSSLFRQIIRGGAALLTRPRQRQVAALVWRYGQNGDVEVLTITTRRSGRWSLPKGWPIKGMTSAEAAAQEAWEEAGVRGRVDSEPLGSFSYEKSAGRNRPDMRMTASLFALHLTELHDEYPEAGQRNRAWHTAAKAAEMVKEPELKALIRAFSP